MKVKSCRIYKYPDKVQIRETSATVFVLPTWIYVFMVQLCAAPTLPTQQSDIFRRCCFSCYVNGNFTYTQVPELCLTQMLEPGRGNLQTLISQPAHTHNAYSVSSPRLIATGRWESFSFGARCLWSGEQHRHQNLLYWHIFPWKSGSTMSRRYEGSELEPACT